MNQNQSDYQDRVPLDVLGEECIEAYKNVSDTLQTYLRRPFAQTAGLEVARAADHSYKMFIRWARRYPIFADEKLWDKASGAAERCKNIIIEDSLLLTAPQQYIDEITDLADSYRGSSFEEDFYDVGEGWPIERPSFREILRQDLRYQIYLWKGNLSEKLGIDPWESYDSQGVSQRMRKGFFDGLETYGNRMRQLGIPRSNARWFLISLGPSPTKIDTEGMTFLDALVLYSFQQFGDQDLFEAMRSNNIPSEHVREVVDILIDFYRVEKDFHHDLSVMRAFHR